MKRNILFILIICALPFFSIAQGRFGISVGAGVSDINNYHNYLHSSFPGTYNYLTEENYFSPTLSWKAGVFFNKSISGNRFEFAMELLVNGMGAYYTFQHIDSNTTSNGHKWQYVYLSVPLNLRYNATKRLFIMAGPTTSLLLKNLDKKVYYGDSRLIDLGVNIALGVSLSTKIDLELQAYHGLIRRNNESFDSFIDKRLFNSSITVSLKYELWKQKKANEKQVKQ